MTTPAQTDAGREIDLKKLATELSAAGYVAGPVECSDEGEYTIAIRDRGAVDPVMTVNHVGFVWPEKVGNLAYYWDLLDIVRWHVSPAPAQDQLRARIRHAVDLHMVSGRGSEVDPITDAVLAVISPSQEMHVAQVPALGQDELRERVKLALCLVPYSQCGCGVWPGCKHQVALQTSAVMDSLAVPPSLGAVPETVVEVPVFDDPDEELAYVLAQAGRRWVPETVVEAIRILCNYADLQFPNGAPWLSEVRSWLAGLAVKGLKGVSQFNPSVDCVDHGGAWDCR